MSISWLLPADEAARIIDVAPRARHVDGRVRAWRDSTPRLLVDSLYF